MPSRLSSPTVRAPPHLNKILQSRHKLRIRGFPFISFPSFHQQIECKSYKPQYSNANHDRHSNNDGILGIISRNHTARVRNGGSFEHFLITVDACVEKGKRSCASKRKKKNQVMPWLGSALTCNIIIFSHKKQLLYRHCHRHCYPRHLTSNLITIITAINIIFSSLSLQTLLSSLRSSSSKSASPKVFRYLNVP